MYIPLNKENFKVGDKVTCIENRYARTYNYKNGFRTYTDDTIPYLTMENTYTILNNDTRRRKVSVIGDDGNEYKVPYYRLGVYID